MFRDTGTKSSVREGEGVKKARRDALIKNYHPPTTKGFLLLLLDSSLSLSSWKPFLCVSPSTNLSSVYSFFPDCVRLQTLFILLRQPRTESNVVIFVLFYSGTVSSSSSSSCLRSLFLTFYISTPRPLDDFYALFGHLNKPHRSHDVRQRYTKRVLSSPGNLPDELKVTPAGTNLYEKEQEWKTDRKKKEQKRKPNGDFFATGEKHIREICKDKFARAVCSLVHFESATRLDFNTKVTRSLWKRIYIENVYFLSSSINEGKKLVTKFNDLPRSNVELRKLHSNFQPLCILLSCT